MHEIRSQPHFGTNPIKIDVTFYEMSTLHTSGKITSPTHRIITKPIRGNQIPTIHPIMEKCRCFPTPGKPTVLQQNPTRLPNESYRLLPSLVSICWTLSPRIRTLQKPTLNINHIESLFKRSPIRKPKPTNNMNYKHTINGNNLSPLSQLSRASTARLARELGDASTPGLNSIEERDLSRWLSIWDYFLAGSNYPRIQAQTTGGTETQQRIWTSLIAHGTETNRSIIGSVCRKIYAQDVGTAAKTHTHTHTYPP